VLVHVRSGAPNAPNGSPASVAGPHLAGCNFLNMDGSCRVITDQVGITVFRALCTHNGGEVIPADALP
jgi:hypothetical protein